MAPPSGRVARKTHVPLRPEPTWHPRRAVAGSLGDRTPCGALCGDSCWPELTNRGRAPPAGRIMRFNTHVRLLGYNEFAT